MITLPGAGEGFWGTALCRPAPPPVRLWLISCPVMSSQWEWSMSDLNYTQINHYAGSFEQKFVLYHVYKWKWSSQLWSNAVTNKAQNKFWGSNGIQTRDLHDSTNWAMKPRWKQVKCEFNLYLLYEENNMMCISCMLSVCVSVCLSVCQLNMYFVSLAGTDFRITLGQHCKRITFSIN